MRLDCSRFFIYTNRDYLFLEDPDTAFGFVWPPPIVFALEREPIVRKISHGTIHERGLTQA